MHVYLKAVISLFVLFFLPPLSLAQKSRLSTDLSFDNSLNSFYNIAEFKSVISENEFKETAFGNPQFDNNLLHSIASKNENNYQLALNLFQSGYEEYINGNLDKASTFFENSLEFVERDKEYKLTMHNYRFLSLIMLEEEKTDSALYFAQQGLDYSYQNKLKGELKKMLLINAIIDLSQSNYLMAVDFFNTISDSANKETYNYLQRESELIFLHAQYKSNVKEQQIIKLEAEREAEKARRNLLFFYFLTFTGIAFTAAIVFYLRNSRNKLLLKKEKDAENLMSRFFVNISHELRTPLTLIMGPIERLLENANKDDEKLLNITYRNSQKLLRLVNQLLDISKIDAGKMELKASRNDIIPVIKGIFSSFQPYADSKGVILKYNNSFDKYKLYFNLDMMEKIISNLISNALKFTYKDGLVSLSLKEDVVHGKKMFVLEIQDTGKGIEEEHIPYIFNRYFQIGKDKNNDWEGTGVGLSLVKELLDLHKGKIKVSSELCVGTKFKVSLPIGRQHLGNEQITELSQSFEEKIISAPAPNSLDELTTTSIIDDNKKLILIVDDNDDMRQYLRRILSKDYRIIESPDGKSGIKKALSYIPSLIICDLMMPKMNGHQLCEVIKNNEATSHIPIVMLTAKNTEEDRLLSLSYKADSFISKPFKTKELTTVISNLISIREDINNKFGDNYFIPELNQKSITPVEKDFLNKVYTIVDKNLANEKFGVEELSMEIGFSRSQFQRKLKTIANTNPNQLIRDYRLKIAREMLSNNSGTISEICYKVGFSSPSYFTKCFTQKYGYAPNEVVQKYYSELNRNA